MHSRDHMLGFPPLIEFLGEKKSTSHLYTPPRARKTLVEQSMDKIRDNVQVPEQYKQKVQEFQVPEEYKQALESMLSGKKLKTRYWTNPDYTYEYRISEQGTSVQYRWPFDSALPELPRPWREVSRGARQVEYFKKLLNDSGWETHYE